jgi:signal transduction histidine kinase
MLTQGEGTAEVLAEDGVRRLYAFTQVHGATDVGMYVSIGIPVDIALAAAHQRLVRNLVALGLVSLLILGATWIGSDLLVLRPINALVGATKRLRAGDLSARTRLPGGHGELDQLATAFDDMAETLERREAERKHAQETLQILSRQLLEAQESERRRLAHELHDELGQGLTAAKLGLQMIEGVSDTAAERLRDSIELVDGVLQQVRNLSLDLRPSLLDDLGLAATLDWYVKRQAERAGLVVHLSVEPLEPRLSPAIETACFRLIQEALTNATRHAQAREVWVEVRKRADALHLRVQDDGVGFDVSAAQKRAALGGSLGVLGMEERVRLVGGHLEIISAPGHGTDVRAYVPLGQASSLTRSPSGAAPSLPPSPVRVAMSEGQNDLETRHESDPRLAGR